MENKKVKKSIRKTRLYWSFYVLSAILLLVGIALMPFWKGKNVFWAGLGDRFFSIVLFVFIFTYITGFLIKQMIRERNMSIKILTIFEAGFFFAIAVGCIMQFFNQASLVDSCTIVGAALWSRGFVYIVKAYLFKHDNEDRYPLWMLIVSVGLVTLGSIMMVKQLFPDELIVWIVAVALVLAAICCFVLAILMKPKPDKEKLKLKKEKRDKRIADKKEKKNQKKLAKKNKAKLPEAKKELEESKEDSKKETVKAKKEDAEPEKKEPVKAKESVKDKEDEKAKASTKAKEQEKAVEVEATQDESEKKAKPVALIEGEVATEDTKKKKTYYKKETKN